MWYNVCPDGNHRVHSTRHLTRGHKGKNALESFLTGFTVTIDAGKSSCSILPVHSFRTWSTMVASLSLLPKNPNKTKYERGWHLFQSRSILGCRTSPCFLTKQSSACLKHPRNRRENTLEGLRVVF